MRNSFGPAKSSRAAGPRTRKRQSSALQSGMRLGIEPLESRYLLAASSLALTALNLPTLSISNATVTEPDSGTVSAVFKITLSAPSAQIVKVAYATKAGSASVGSDFVAKSATLAFDPGVTQRSVSILVQGDTLVEADEAFTVELSAPTGATVLGPSGVGTIKNDDILPTTFFLSLRENATVSSSTGVALPVANADIFRLDVPAGGGYQYSQYFDGSDVGLSTLDEDVDAFDILPDGSIVLSTLGPFSLQTTYSAPGVGSGATLNGTNRDLLKFTPSSLGKNTTGKWSVILQGSTVGLEYKSENIDAVAVLPDGRILISAEGSLSVAAGIAGRDDDLLAYNPATHGWEVYFDGRDVGLDTTSAEDIDGLWVEQTTTGLPVLHFSTRGKFDVTGVSGADEDVLRFVPTQLGSVTKGAFDTSLALDGSRYGLGAFDVDGFEIVTLAGTSSASQPARIAAARADVANATPASSASSASLAASPSHTEFLLRAPETASPSKVAKLVLPPADRTSTVPSRVAVDYLLALWSQGPSTQTGASRAPTLKKAIGSDASSPIAMSTARAPLSDI